MKIKSKISFSISDQIKVAVILALLIVTIFTGCQTSTPTETDKQNPLSESLVVSEPTYNPPDGDLLLKYGVTEDNYPRIDGSTSTLGIVQQMYGALCNDFASVPETASKTVPSYEKLINDEVDLIIVPYASEDVLNFSRQKGVTLEFFPIAAEALIFITSVENTANDITTEQVRNIYLNYGIRNWNQLGGPDRELVPLCRNADSGSQAEMDRLILQNESMHNDIQKNFVQLTMDGILEQTAFYHAGGDYGDIRPTNSYALGYTLYTFLQNRAKSDFAPIAEHLKILSFEGVSASYSSIVNGSYPLATQYYAVVRNDLPQEHSARNILRFLQNEDGKYYIHRAGLIPMP